MEVLGVLLPWNPSSFPMFVLVYALVERESQAQPSGWTLPKFLPVPY